MAKKIAQYRYYNDGNENNYPASLTKAELANGKRFSALDIYQLGIQTVPGTIFYLQETENPIIVGTTGIFELELHNETTVINSLKFDGRSLDIIASNPNTSLIIDIIYEEV